ncbi:MAG: DUF512 domain-containing protein [Candidatus Sumerlaeaceae bacterium]
MAVMPRTSTKTESHPAAPSSVGVRVAFVDPNSQAARLGIGVGDALLRLNGNVVDDVIDYWFHMAAERLKVEWHTADGKLKIATLRKPYHERLGVEVEPFEIKRCNNACVFCFVHQLPPGMRRELYVKDEDYRLSFLYGNYITGTNLSPADKERIIRQKLSPLYFSVHATDQDLRERLLVKRNIEPIVPLLKDLTNKGIFVHAQVVLCPGLNDGAMLEKTVMELATLYPKLESIAVVPLGMTDHRGRLPQLQPITPEYARTFVREIAKLQKKVARKIGYPLVFPSDEFFLIGDMQPPDYDKYPEIPQLANGVGMYYRFYEHFDALCAELPTKLERPRRVAAITTHMGVQVLEKLVDAMNARVDGLHVDLLPTVNSLFGEGITVSGLLPGSDFKRQIAANPCYDRYMIPENALRPWDKRFLDDMLLAELQECTEAEVVTGADTAESFIAAALL